MSVRDIGEAVDEHPIFHHLYRYAVMMLWNNAAKKILLVSYEPVLTQQFTDALASSGVFVELVHSGVNLASLLKKEQCSILINPSFREFNEHTDLLKRKTDRCLFILSSDERWKTIANGQQIYYLQADTHPLELARLLVEKLNLPAVSNKTSYAFSFFQF